MMILQCSILRIMYKQLHIHFTCCDYDFILYCMLRYVLQLFWLKVTMILAQSIYKYDSIPVLPAIPCAFCLTFSKAETFSELTGPFLVIDHTSCAHQPYSCREKYSKAKTGKL